MSLKTFAEGATMHGFGRIITTKSKLVKTFWLFFILSFSSLLGYHLYLILSRYLKNHSVIKESTIIAPELEFPSITICGPSVSNAKHRDFTRNRNISQLGAAEDDAIFDSFDLLRRIETKENLYNITGDKDDFLATKIEGCFFGIGRKCDFSTDFDEVLVFLRSYCYRFNPKGALKQKRPGSTYGLSMILFLNTSDMVPDSFIANGDAVEIIIQHHAEYPFIDSGTVLAPTGHLSQIQIQRREIERMQTPYPSNCTVNTDSTLVFPGEYTTTNCIESCFATKSAQVCNGVEFYANAFLPDEKKMPLLKTAEGLRCLEQLYFNLSNTKFSECNCNLPCLETHFQKFVSYSKWPSTVDLPKYRKQLSKALNINASQITDEFVRNNLMQLRVFFADMTYKVLKEQKKYSFEGLVSDIGGQMGIWIGASVFSVIELLYIVGQLVRGLFTSQKDKTNDVVLQNIKIEK